MQHQPKTTRRVSVKGHPGIYHRLGADGKRQYEINWYGLDDTGRKRRFWRRVEGNLEDAKARREAERASSRRGERKPSAQEQRRSFREVAAGWLDTQAHLRPRTRERYESAIRVHLVPALGGLRIGDVSEDEIAAFVAAMQAKGAAGWTIKATLTPLGRILDHATRRRLIPSNPLRALASDERPRVTRRTQRILDSDEIGKVLDACPQTYRPIIATAIFTGLRQGELLGLTWADVDFEAGVVHVTKQLDRKTGERVEPKTAQAVRDVVLMPALAAILRRHKAASGHSQERDFVFSTRSGRAHNGRNVSQRGLDVALEKVGVGEHVERETGKPRWRSAVTFHGLRHTFASLLIAQGADVVHVSRQVGHASPKITLDVYAHLFDAARHAEQTRDRLEAAYGTILEPSAGERRRDRAAAAGGEVLSLQAKRD